MIFGIFVFVLVLSHACVPATPPVTTCIQVGGASGITTLSYCGIYAVLHIWFVYFLPLLFILCATCLLPVPCISSIIYVAVAKHACCICLCALHFQEEDLRIGRTGWLLCILLARQAYAVAAALPRARFCHTFCAHFTVACCAACWRYAKTLLFVCCRARRHLPALHGFIFVYFSYLPPAAYYTTTTFLTEYISPAPA